MTTPSASVSYTSDARNLRQSRTVGSATQQFTWSTVGALPLLLDDGEHSYIYGASSTPLAQVDDSTGLVQYLHADLLGTPRLVTDSAGSQVGTVSFDAFGTVAAQTGVQSAFGFTGNWADPDTGLLYLRARDYDPATGQFLTVDPLVDKTRQAYAYTGNNPVSRTDPSGLDWLHDLWAIDMTILLGLVGLSPVLGSDDAEAGVLGGWLLDQTESDLTYGEGTELVCDLQTTDVAKDIRDRVAEGLRTGNMDTVYAAYSAGNPLDLSTGHLFKDVETVFFWGTDFVTPQDRLQVSLGSYQIAGSVTAVDDLTGMASVRFSGSNTTSLGSALHFDDASYEFWNDFSDATGFLPSKTQNYFWDEEICWDLKKCG